MRLNEADKKMVRLKNFESSLLQLRHSIRGIKNDFRKNIHLESCDKLKETYKQKLEDYTVKELNHLVKMIKNY
ncbi:hypothetical protein [Hyunsoonleella ulvae]|uniref:hypothetical protein n=1 Tax=Hyunsoonleella ulvae TaxID=2799948 RepID=UPI00193AC321|nr:hypothetical protein [Hyunsoonleella ulvae]